MLGGGKKKSVVSRHVHDEVDLHLSTVPRSTEQTTATNTHNKCCVAGTTSNAEAFSFLRAQKRGTHAIITNITSKIGSRARPASL